MTLLELLSLIKRNLGLVIVITLACFFIGSAVAFLTPAKYSAIATINLTAEAGSAGGYAEGISKSLGSKKGVDVTVKTDSTAKQVTLTATGTDSDVILSVLDAVVSETETKTTSLFGEKIVIDNTVPTNTVKKSSNLFMYAAVGLLAGLFAAICLIVIKDMIKSPIHSKEEVEEGYNIKYLGNCSGFQSSSRAGHGKSSNSSSLLAFSERETLLSNVFFISNSAESFSVIPVSSSDNSYAVTSDLLRASQEGNLQVEAMKASSSEKFFDDFINNANNYGKIAFISTKSIKEGVAASYAAYATDATVLVLCEWETTRKELEETLHQLSIAKANIVGFVTAPQNTKTKEKQTKSASSKENQCLTMKII